MSKTNDTLRPATLDDRRPLTDSELDAVSGGISDMNQMDMLVRGICPFPDVC